MKVTRAWWKVYLLMLAAFAFTGEEAGEHLRAVTYLEWWFPLKTPSAVFWDFLIGEHVSFWWPDLTLDGSSRKNGATLSLVSSRGKSGSRTQNLFFSRRTEPENTAIPPLIVFLAFLHLFCLNSCDNYWYGSNFCWQWICFYYYFKVGFPCNLGWPWTLNPSVPISKELKIQACITTLALKMNTEIIPMSV